MTFAHFEDEELWLIWRLYRFKIPPAEAYALYRQFVAEGIADLQRFLSSPAAA